jgi:hypothetical protein
MKLADKAKKARGRLRVIETHPISTPTPRRLQLESTLNLAQYIQIYFSLNFSNPFFFFFFLRNRKGFAHFITTEIVKNVYTDLHSNPFIIASATITPTLCKSIGKQESRQMSNKKYVKYVIEYYLFHPDSPNEVSIFPPKGGALYTSS